MTAQSRERQYKALLIGITYGKTKQALLGPAKDVHRMEDFLIKHLHYRKDDIVVMTDEDYNRNTKLWPTRANIIEAIKALIDGARGGDVFVFQYAGHTDQVDALVDKREDDGKDERILTRDKMTILDDDLFNFLIKPLPPGARLTAILDACHSGTLLDLFHYKCNWAPPRRHSHNDAVIEHEHLGAPRKAISLEAILLGGERLLKATFSVAIKLALAIVRMKTMVKPKSPGKPNPKSDNNTSDEEPAKPSVITVPAIPNFTECSGQCRAQAFENGPLVISISACSDHEFAWEDPVTGAALSSILIGILKHKPCMSLEELGKTLRKRLFKSGMDRKWRVFKKRRTLGKKDRQRLDEQLEQLDFFNVQTPLLGGLHHLRRDTPFFLARFEAKPKLLGAAQRGFERAKHVFSDL